MDYNPEWVMMACIRYMHLLNLHIFLDIAFHYSATFLKNCKFQIYLSNLVKRLTLNINMNATLKIVLSIVDIVWQPGVFRTAINSRHDAQNRVWNAKKTHSF